MSSAGRTRRRRRRKGKSAINLSGIQEFVELQKWMRDNGWSQREQPVLKPADFPLTGRGLMATRHIRENEVLISVPSRLLITPDTVLNSDIVGPHLKSWPRPMSSVQMLSLYLLVEKYGRLENSFWTPFLSVLPERFGNPAAYFSREELDLLPLGLRERAGSGREELERRFQEVRQFLLSCPLSATSSLSASLSFDQFCWAWFAVNTRCVYLDHHSHRYHSSSSPHLLPNDSNCALVPMLDLLNHSCQATVTAGYNSDSECYEIRTLNAYRRYDQVFINYGPHSNDKLLLEYGFVCPHNPHTVVQVSLDQVLDLTRLSDDEAALIKQCCSSLGEDQLYVSRDGLSWDLERLLVFLASGSAGRQHQWKQLLFNPTKALAEPRQKKYEQLTQELLINMTECYKKLMEAARPVEVSPSGAVILTLQLLKDKLQILQNCSADLQPDGKRN